MIAEYKKSILLQYFEKTYNRLIKIQRRLFFWEVCKDRKINGKSPEQKRMPAIPPDDEDD